MTPPPATMGFKVQVRASHITGSTLTANMLPTAHHIACPHFDSTDRRVEVVIVEDAAAVADTDTNTPTPREDGPPSAVHLPRRRRIRVRTARIANTSVERPTKKRPRPITRSHPTARWTPPLEIGRASCRERAQASAVR